MDGRTDEARRRLGFVASSWLPTRGGNASSLHCTEIGRGRKRERKRPSHGPYGPTTAGLLGSCVGWARWRHIGRSEWSQHAQVACSAQPSPAQPSSRAGLAHGSWLMSDPRPRYVTVAKLGSRDDQNAETWRANRAGDAASGQQGARVTCGTVRPFLVRSLLYSPTEYGTYGTRSNEHLSAGKKKQKKKNCVFA